MSKGWLCGSGQRQDTGLLQGGSQGPKRAHSPQFLPPGCVLPCPGQVAAKGQRKTRLRKTPWEPGPTRGPSAGSPAAGLCISGRCWRLCALRPREECHAGFGAHAVFPLSTLKRRDYDMCIVGCKNLRRGLVRPCTESHHPTGRRAGPTCASLGLPPRPPRSLPIQPPLPYSYLLHSDFQHLVLHRHTGLQVSLARCETPPSGKGGCPCSLPLLAGTGPSCL